MNFNNKWTRRWLFLWGWFFFGLGFIGLFFPLLPTTPFMLLASWCFLKSSPRAYKWLYRQPLIGQVLKDWEVHRAIRQKTKILATSMILVSMVFIWLRLSYITLKIAVTICLMAIVLFIVSRPSHKS